jgi:beta-phosphoglucomutase-like phosphatase (HAD superfamily)
VTHSIYADMSAAGPPQGARAPRTGEAGALHPAWGSAPRAAGSVGAIIFDMDGTMIDSMPFHQKSWVEFCVRHGIAMDVPELMRRTTGRNGAECMSELFGKPVPPHEAWALVHEKEEIYRALFAPVFSEVRGFKAFARSARERGLKIGVGTAGDKHNIAFAMKHLALDFSIDAVVGGDQGLPGKPEPAIFLEAARAMNTPSSSTIVFEDAPLGIRAVAICTSHNANELSGPHVIAAVRDYTELQDLNFWEICQ